MPVGGGAETRVLDSVHPGSYGAWEQGIYFFAPPDEQNHSALCLYEFTTGKTSKILTIEQDVGAYIDISPDGRMILYTQHDDAGSDLMLLENFK